MHIHECTPRRSGAPRPGLDCASATHAGCSPRCKLPHRDLPCSVAQLLYDAFGNKPPRGRLSQRRGPLPKLLWARVDINRDFLNKNKKIGFFDLNQTSRFKLNFLTNVYHLLGISNSSQT